MKDQVIHNEVIQNYLQYLNYEKNYSEDTINSYAKDLLQYISYLQEKQLRYLEIQYDDIKGYLIYLNDLNNSSASIARKISSIRSFYRYLVNQEIINSNPFLSVKLPKKEKKLPRFFHYNELEELFKIPDLSSSLGQRDRLILELLYATGIRVSELVNIKLSDIHEREIKILGKGDRERIVRFGDYAEEALQRYLQDGYYALNKNNSPYLFLNKNHTQLSSRGVRKILDHIIEKTTIDKKISPHMLRHSFATHLLNEGCDLLSVQQLLGHTSLSATSIYTHITTDRMKEIYFKTHPRAKK